ncbi:MAG: chromate transporter [Sarcina sp.]
MKRTLHLLLTFLKVGVSIHGGGYVLIGVMQREIVEKQQLMDEEEYMEIIAVCQSLPGPLAVTAPTFVGFVLGEGIIGALVCLFGILIPAFIAITLIAAVFTNFGNIIYVKHALLGIRAAVPVLILLALVNFWKKLNKTAHNFLFAAVALFCLEYFKLNAAILIVFSAIYGIVLNRILARKKGGDK